MCRVAQSHSSLCRLGGVLCKCQSLRLCMLCIGTPNAREWIVVGDTFTRLEVSTKFFLQQDIVLAGHQQIKQHEEYPDQFDSMIVPCHFGPTEGGHKLSMHRSNYAEDKYARSNYVVFGEQRHLSRKCKTANALIR